MRGHNVLGAAYSASAAIGREYNDWRESALERSMQVREALDVEHVHLVDEENAWHELSYALIDVLVNHFVDLFAQFVLNASQNKFNQTSIYKRALYCILANQ